MPKTFYPDLIRILRENGFCYIPDRGKGSHEIWRNAETGRTVHVPRNLYARHTANGILKQAGLLKAF